MGVVTYIIVGNGCQLRMSVGKCTTHCRVKRKSGTLLDVKRKEAGNDLISVQMSPRSLISVLDYPYGGAVVIFPVPRSY